MPYTDWYSLLSISDLASTNTIKFSLLNNDWAPVYRRRQYEQYGAIRSCVFGRVHGVYHEVSDPPLTCYIEFEDPRVVSDMFLRGYICINDIKIKIKRIEQRLNDDESDDSFITTTENSLLELPDKGLSENILNVLNDDCLREIFRKLHLLNLHIVSKVCVRFNRIAKEIFKLKYKNEIFRFCDVVMDYPISLRQAKNFLRNFGPSIEKMTITGVEVAFNEKLLHSLLKAISKYCINIYGLKMDSKLCVTDEILIELRQLFGRLKYLKFRVRHTQKLNASLLPHSQIDKCIPTEIELPELTHLTVDLHTYQYLNNLKCNFQLKTLSIWTASIRYTETSLRIMCFETSLFQDIPGKFPNIDKLSIVINCSYGVSDREFATNILHLTKLKRLQRLTLDVYRKSFSPLLKKMVENNVELKYLKLRRCQFNDDDVNTISQMKSIEELCVGYEFKSANIPTGLSTNQLQRLLMHLPNLNVVSVWKHPDTVKIVDFILQVIPFAKQVSILNMRVSEEYEELPDFNEKICIELTKVIQKREKSKKLTITIDSFAKAPVNMTYSNARHKTVINNEWLCVNISFYEIKVKANKIPCCNTLECQYVIEYL